MDRVRWAGDNSLLPRREILHLERNLPPSALSPGGCGAQRGREGCAGGLLGSEPGQTGRQSPHCGSTLAVPLYLTGTLLPHGRESGNTSGMLGRKLGSVPAAHPPCGCTCTPAMASTVPMPGTRAGVSWRVLPDPDGRWPPTAQQLPSLHTDGRMIQVGCGEVPRRGAVKAQLWEKPVPGSVERAGSRSGSRARGDGTACMPQPITAALGKLAAWQALA